MFLFLGWMKEEIPFGGGSSQQACIPLRGTAQGVMASAYITFGQYISNSTTEGDVSLSPDISIACSEMGAVLVRQYNLLKDSFEEVARYYGYHVR